MHGEVRRRGFPFWTHIQCTCALRFVTQSTEILIVPQRSQELSLLHGQKKTGIDYRREPKPHSIKRMTLLVIPRWYALNIELWSSLLLNWICAELSFDCQRTFYFERNHTFFLIAWHMQKPCGRINYLSIKKSSMIRKRAVKPNDFKCI